MDKMSAKLLKINNLKCQLKRFNLPVVLPLFATPRNPPNDSERVSAATERKRGAFQETDALRFCNKSSASARI